jgi:AGZA family xanthine/uracil permease-like MFS transporter
MVMDAQTHTAVGVAPAKPLSTLDGYFLISERGSTTATEILAGVSTFLALSYIFVVNPAILGQAGIPISLSLFATITISALATILMGVWAKLPFAVSTGLEINGYVAFVVIGAMGFTWQQALGMVFWSGVIMMVVTVASIREKVIDSIPDPLKIGLSFSVGMFLVLIAMKLSGIFIYKGLVLSGCGSLISPAAICLYIGLVAILVLERLKVLGSVLISIIGVTVLYHALASGGGAGFTPVTSSGTPGASKEMFSGIGALSPSILLDPRAWSVILVLFIIDFYGSVAKLIGLTLRTSLMASGKLPGREKALLVDGGGTALASMIGTTSVVAFVESAVGIGAGGRTGLSSLVCGVLMAACFLAMPFIHLIPVGATLGALVYVGFRLCPAFDQWKAMAPVDKLTLISMPLITIATFSLDKAMVVGFVLATLSALFKKQSINPYLAGSAALLVVSMVLQASF